MTANPPSVIIAAVFDAKPYAREALQQASANRGIEWQFLEFRLMQGTAFAAKNARVGADYFTSGIPDTSTQWPKSPALLWPTSRPWPAQGHSSKVR